MVNIFIIVPDIYMTAKMLDQKRLCKQRVEAKQIIEILEEYDRTGQLTKSWSSNPATKSWLGYTNHLKVYFNIICREWIQRGFNQTMPLYVIDETPYNIVPSSFDGRSISFDRSKINQFSFPIWVSFYPFYMSHQASLCRKDPKFYKFLLKDELNPFLNHGYLWPTKIDYNCLTNWNFSYHELLLSGTPPVYRINSRQVLEWLKNVNCNPKSGRKITETSVIYQDNLESMKGHNIVIANGIVFIENNPLCYVNDINSGISSLDLYMSNNGGYPNPCQLVYKKSQN